LDEWLKNEAMYVPFQALGGPFPAQNLHGSGYADATRVPVLPSAQRPDAATSAMTEPTRGTSPADRDESDMPPPQASLRQIVVAVFWSFFGVRKGEAMRRDVVTIKPHQVIIVAILLAAGLVVALVILVRLITRNA